MLQDNFLDRKQRLINMKKKKERNQKPHRSPSLKWPPSQHSSLLTLVLLGNRALTHGNDPCKKAKLHTITSGLSPVMEGWETSQQSRSETQQCSNLTAVIHLTEIPAPLTICLQLIQNLLLVAWWQHIL